MQRFVLIRIGRLCMIPLPMSRRDAASISIAQISAVDGGFRTTCWSKVLEAGEGGERALEELLSAYWYPLYAFLRRSGHGEHDAQDLTQGFLAHLLERQRLEQADQERGRFRSFLLGSLKHFVANSKRHHAALKRGGGYVFVPLEGQGVEERFRLDSNDALSPLELFEKSWALSVLDSAMERLGQELHQGGRGEIFEALRPRLSGGGSADVESYAKIGAGLGMSANSVTVTMHRLRHRYGEILRDEIADTVSEPGEIDEELRYLMGVVAG